MITRFITISSIGIVILLSGPNTSLAHGGHDHSLYERLGGLAPISVLVNEFIEALVTDKIINQNPAVDSAWKRVPIPYLKYQLTTMVCSRSRGPCLYTGRGMQESHAHLNITKSEWERMVVIFKEVLAKHKVPAKESQELLKIVESHKSDIVVKQKSE